MAKRTHVPALNKDKLALALQHMDQTRIAPASKELLKNIIRAAANPKAESADAVILTMPTERRQNVTATQKTVSRHVSGVTSRGKAALDALSDSEWDRLVNGE